MDNILLWLSFSSHNVSHENLTLTLKKKRIVFHINSPYILKRVKCYVNIWVVQWEKRMHWIRSLCLVAFMGMAEVVLCAQAYLFLWHPFSRSSLLLFGTFVSIACLCFHACMHLSSASIPMSVMFFSHLSSNQIKRMEPNSTSYIFNISV